VAAAAREAGVIVPVGAVVAQLMASAVANGEGGLDHSALLLGVERLSGRQGSARGSQESEAGK
jgi:2-hydroxy-3-oxopropionate reductase